MSGVSMNTVRGESTPLLDPVQKPKKPPVTRADRALSPILALSSGAGAVACGALAFVNRDDSTSVKVFGTAAAVLTVNAGLNLLRLVRERTWLHLLSSNGTVDVEKLSATLQQITKEIVSGNQDLEKLVKLDAEADLEEVSLKQNDDPCAEDWEQLHSALKTQKRLITAATRDLTGLRTQIEEKERELTTIKQQPSDPKKELAATGELEALRAQLQEKQRQLGELGQLREINKTLSEELLALKDSLASKSKTIEALIAQKDELSAQLEAKSSIVAALENKIRENVNFALDLEVAQASIRELSLQLESAKRRYEEVTEDAQSGQTDSDALIAAEKAKVQRLETELADKSSTIANLNDRARESVKVAQELAAALTEVDRLKVEVETLTTFAKASSQSYAEGLEGRDRRIAELESKLAEHERSRAADVSQLGSEIKPTATTRKKKPAPTTASTAKDQIAKLGASIESEKKQKSEAEKKLEGHRASLVKRQQSGAVTPAAEFLTEKLQRELDLAEARLALMVAEKEVVIAESNDIKRALEALKQKSVGATPSQNSNIASGGESAPPTIEKRSDNK